MYVDGCIVRLLLRLFVWIDNDMFISILLHVLAMRVYVHKRTHRCSLAYLVVCCLIRQFACLSIDERIHVSVYVCAYVFV